MDRTASPSKLKWFALIAVLALSMITITGCISTENQKNTTNGTRQLLEDISTVDAYAMTKANANNQDFVILDIRTPGEFADGHIEGALNIDYYSDTFTQELDKLDKTKIYLIYCRTANRSGNAMPIMKDLGFLEVYNMLGGIVQWDSLGYPVVS